MARTAKTKVWTKRAAEIAAGVEAGKTAQPPERRPLLVGEVNPYGTDPDMALYPLPENASGGRLAEILGLSRAEYLRHFDRVNLCLGKWSLPEARRAAGQIERGRPLVLLGAKVAEAFGFPNQPFTANPPLFFLPHPSGRNLIWNDPASAQRARSLLRDVLPGAAASPAAPPRAAAPAKTVAPPPVESLAGGPVPERVFKLPALPTRLAADLLAKFPGTPRPQQVEALEKIAAAYANGAQYVILEAPAGSGKSHCAAALSRVLGPSYITTLTAQLQEQYHALFRHLGLEVLKGRGKYQCARARESCAVGKELFKGESACTPCAYTQAKERALAAPIMACNYHSFWWNIAMAPGAPGERPPARPLMILDEVHGVESFLLSEMGVEVKLRQYSAKLPELPKTDDSAEPYLAWLREAVPALKGTLAAVTDPKTKEELERRVMRMSGIVRDAANGIEFIPERGSRKGEDGKWGLDPGWFGLKPLTVATYGKRLWKYGERVLLMSATILDAATVAANLGLPLDSGEFIRLDSVFPAENRPIVVNPLNMTKEARDDSWPQMVHFVDKLLDHHAGEKGLLLCPSNEMLKYVQSKVSRKNANRFILAFGDAREEQYRRHVEGPGPTVLAASGYWEGADLVGDASRFQIIPAVPRAMWSGQIKARARISPGWYRWLSYCKLLQGYGRSVRSVDDSAVTYIFDQEFLAEMNRPGSLIPQWVRSAVRVVGQ